MEYPHHFDDTLTPSLRRGTFSLFSQTIVARALHFYLHIMERLSNQEVKALIKIHIAVAAASWITFSFSAHHSTFPTQRKKKKVYSKFPSPFKLVMGSATDAFTTRDINFFIRSKVLGVNSVYCMRCQGNYRWSALFLRTARASGGGSPPCLQMHHRRIAALSFSQPS